MRPCSRWSAFWLWFWLLLPSPFVVAQTPPLIETGVTSRESRERMFQELARDVEVFERQGAILKKVFQLARPSVVHIEARKPEPGSAKPVEEAGSGIIIEHRGKWYVITNRHVVINARTDQIDIRLDTRRNTHPLRIWSDDKTDIAVMALAEKDLVSARLGSSDEVEIGDFVIAVGSPFGLSNSVTYGIVSAKSRRDLELGEGDGKVTYQDFIQTDAAINPGNSGGPLLNLRGEVIGLNTAIASSSGGNEGIGFSTPINMVIFVANQLIESNRVVRGMLGVTLDNEYTSEAAERLGLTHKIGARIKGVTPNSAAAAARLASGDVIVAFNGVPIEDDNHLINQVSYTPVGKAVPLKVLRDGRAIELDVQLLERKP